MPPLQLAGSHLAAGIAIRRRFFENHLLLRD